MEHNEDLEHKYGEHLTPQSLNADEILKPDKQACGDRKHVLKPPDGGWGWAVCAACFMSHVLTDGIFYSFGVVFVELLDYYRGSKGETAIIASLSTGVCFLGGPVVAMVTNKYGCRVTAAVGTFIASGSLILSVFAPTIQFLYFSLGAMFGIGYGMIYLPSIVCVSQYFEKRRAFATGIGVSGAGIGTFLFSPLTSLLIRTYTWQGAILIQAGLVLNCLACAFVYRPICYNTESGNENERGVDYADVRLENIYTENNEQYTLNQDIADRKDSSETSLDASCSKSVSKVSAESSDCKDPSRHVSEQPLLNHNTTERTTERTNENPETEKISTLSGILNRVYKSVRTSFDISIFRNVAYNMFLVSTFLYSLGYYIPYIYLPDTAREAGISELKGSFLVSSIGITNTIGRVLFGFLSDRKGVNRLVLYATALAICGAATCVGPLLYSFEMLLVYTVVFGAFSGVTISLTSVLLSDIVGIHRIADGLGVSNFFAGIGSFAGPPLAGWLYDVTGDYLVSYIAAGATIFISGVMLFPIPYIEKKFKQKSTFTSH